MLFGKGNGHYAPKSNKYPLQEGPFWTSWRSLVREENILGCGDMQRGGKERMEIDVLNPVLKNCIGASQVALVVKNPHANAGDVRNVGSIPGSGRSPGGGQATYSSILAWRIPWTEEPGGLQSMGSQRVGCDWSDWTWELHCRDFPGPVVKALQRAWVQFLVGELTSHMLLSST